MKLYHIDRGGTLREGMEINYIKNISLEKPYLKKYSDEFINNIYPEGLSNHGRNYFLQGYRNESMTMDVIFEYERRLHYPEKLSRFQAFYTFDANGVVDFFINKSLETEYCVIYEIEVEKYERHDMNLVSGWSNFDTAIAAKYYWEDLPTFQEGRTPIYEYLLRLPIKIGKRVTYDEVKEESKLLKIKMVENLSKDHFTLLERVIDKINPQDIHNILDCGSGRTSLSILTKQYPKEPIDAIVCYSDQRKIDSINNNVFCTNISVSEKDICRDEINKPYDLVLAHLLLGESKMFGNTFERVFTSLMNIKTKYIIIMDYKEDPIINYEYMEKYFKDNNLEVVYKDILKKEEPQKFANFVGENYVAYLIKKNDL